MRRLLGHWRWFHLAIVLSSSLTPIAFGQGKGGGGFAPGGLSPGGDSSVNAIADPAKAAAFRERFLMLSTKFKHAGVDFQSKSGMGCIISTPQGQRILAMPLSMTMPVDVVQGKEKLSVACSKLLAAKVGSTDKSTEHLAIFTERVDEIPMESPAKQPRKEPLQESELRIDRTLNERGEINFNAMPLSQVVKYFRGLYEIPIVLDEKALEEVGITPDEQITLELPPVTFRSALRLILKPLNLTFVIKNEVLNITTNKEANKEDDPVNHWNPAGPELESERRIFFALNEKGEVSFNAMPLSRVLKHFKNTYEIPIVLDEKALEEVGITPDEPITLELPPVSFRSALNLILDPLELTYVIENEVLLVTSKAKALTEQTAPTIGANSKGVSASGSEVGMGGMGGMGGGGKGLGQAIHFNFLSKQRYGSLQEVRKAGAGLSTGGGMMMAAARHEYAAISGPLATAVDKTLGVAFVCLPGDFQAVPIPAGVKAAGKRFSMLGKSWIEITEDKNSLADVLNGSPVIDQQGESIGLFIDQKVVSLPELAQSLLSVDCKRLGFWGEETIDQKTDEQTDEKTEPEEDPFAGPAQVESTGALPGLLTTELKKSIERVATLKGKEKEAGLKAVQREFDKRIQLRKEYAAANLKSAQSKLERLNQLSAQLSKQDVEKVIQLLQEKPSAAPASPDASKDDPFK